jgi:hypothetical protein
MIKYNDNSYPIIIIRTVPTHFEVPDELHKETL